MTPPVIPLASLRPNLERGWPPSIYEVGSGWRPGARWLPNGVDARGDLAQPARAEIAFRLCNPDGARLRATVALDDPSTRGVHRVAVGLRLPSEKLRILWKGLLAAISGRSIPRQRSVVVSLPSLPDAELVLIAGADVVWGSPEIELPGAPPESLGAEVADPEERGGQAKPRSASAAPLISILMPVHDPPPGILEEAIASVRDQTLTDWELCIADDGSRDERAREIVARSAEEDERVRWVRREQAGGISAATNTALEIARGEYVALLDHDDTLAPDALAQVADLLAERPETDWIYSDEEVVADGVRIHAYRKPGWSPDLLRTQMYASHLGVYRRSLAQEIGFRSAFDGSQDYDFALRFSERTDRIAHIPRVLYSWRAHSGSVAGNPHSKPGAYPAAVRALSGHLSRTAPSSEIHYGFSPGLYRVLHRLDPEVRVGVVVAAEPWFGGFDELFASLADPAAAGLSLESVEVVGSHDFGAHDTSGLDAIVLIEGTAVPLTRGWLARLVGFAMQPGIGAVGPKITAVSGLVEEAGMAVADGTPLPLMSGSAATDGGPLTMALLPSNVTAVGGVLAAPADVFDQLGGADEELGSLALADFCLRARAVGLRTVLAADAILRRPRGWAATNDLAALARFTERWSDCGQDPFFDLSWGWPGSELQT